MKLPKINIGTSTKRAFFDMSHDVSTTCDFGFEQPTLIHPLLAKSKVNLKTSSFVRLAPMPCPTFGRVKVNTDTVFVPATDVQENFDQMVSGVSYSTPFGSSTVDHSDYVFSNRLFGAIIRLCAINNEQFTKDTFGSGTKELFSQMFRFSLSTNSNFRDVAPHDWIDLQTWYNSFGLSNTARYNYVNLIFSLLSGNSSFYDAYDPVTKTVESYPFWRRLGLSSTGDMKNFWYNNQHVDWFLHAFYRPIELLQFDRQVSSDLVFPDLVNKCISAYSGLAGSFRPYFDQSVTSDNADFSFQWIPEFIPQLSGDITSNDINVSWHKQSVDNLDSAIYYRLNMKLTPFGKRLFKVFNACHMNFGVKEVSFDLNRLFAYYKAWFDLYNPGRVKNWRDTNAYYLIHAFYDTRIATNDFLFNGSSIPEDYNYFQFSHLVDFLYDLSRCVYYLDVDPITVCTRLPEQYVNNGSVSYFGRAGNFYQNSLTGNSVVSSYPTVSGNSIVQNTSQSVFSSISVKLLERLYNAVNKESVLASRIEDIMRTRYGVDIRTIRVVGRDSFYCQISDIMGTVNNDATALGEYAGKGIGSGDGTVNFETDCFGYLVQMVSIVPLGGYVQANEKSLINKYDYYLPEFDSLGMEPVTSGEVLARESIINNFSSAQTFGFRPRYFNLKYKNNLNNGGFSFRSERASFLPYCLDRLFSEGSYNAYSNTRDSSQYGTITYGNYQINKPLSLYPVEELRSIGLFEVYGNYDRIFYDTTGLSDNFILHQLQDFKYYASMKPIQDSFDTVNDETDNDVSKVVHN